MASSSSHQPPAPGFIRLATSSPASAATTAQTLAHIRTLARRAATAHHADLLLLPEAYLGGYPRGSAFDCVVGQRTAQGRDEFLQYWEQAVDLGDVVGEGSGGGGADWVARRLPGDEDRLDGLQAMAGTTTGLEEGGEREGGNGAGKAKRGGGEGARRGDGTREVLEGIAAETGVFLVTGLIEKAGGSLYCAVVYVCPQRGIIGKRRKVLPTGTERLIWAQGSPRTLQAVSTRIRGVRINMAAAICWESYMPLLRQTLYAQNINLYLAPTADGRDAWLGLMRTVGVEGRCFVVSSNMCVREQPNKKKETEETGTTNTTTSSSFANGGEEEDEEEVVAAAAAAVSSSPKNTTGRRNSTITEDGFEIALPKSKGEPKIPSSSSANGKPATAAAAAAAAAPQSSKFVSRGGSCITNPQGDVLAGPSWENDEEIIYADVDFKDCIRARLDSDAAGSYSRNDSFKLSVEGFTPIPLPY